MANKNFDGFIEWDTFRNEDGYINMVDIIRWVYKDSPSTFTFDSWDAAVGYLTLISTYQPIRSRQAAAVAISTAITMLEFKDENDVSVPSSL